MSSDPFPEHLDVLRLFARNGSVVATLPLSRLHRFAEHLLDTKGEVEVSLHFGHDEEQRPLLTGTLHTEVRVSCQRCMEPLELEIDTELALLVLESEAQVKALQDEDAVLDTLVMDPEKGFDALAVIEDELLLSLPFVPKHEESDCSELLNAWREKREDEEGGDANKEASNPFAVLARLKRDNDPN